MKILVTMASTLLILTLTACATPSQQSQTQGGFWTGVGKALQAVNTGLQAGNNSINQSMQSNPAPMMDMTPRVTKGQQIQLQGVPTFSPQTIKTTTCNSVVNGGVISTLCN